MAAPYRNEMDTLEARKRSLQSELESVEERIQQRRRLPLLANAKVATPCSVKWDDMVGDERKRHCASCDKSVFNVSSLTSDEAEQFLHENLGRQVCVNFFYRDDGTILTSDCPVGIAQRLRRTKLAVLVGTAVLAVAATVGISVTRAKVGTTHSRAVSGGL